MAFFYGDFWRLKSEYSVLDYETSHIGFNNSYSSNIKSNSLIKEL